MKDVKFTKIEVETFRRCYETDAEGPFDPGTGCHTCPFTDDCPDDDISKIEECARKCGILS